MLSTVQGPKPCRAVDRITVCADKSPGVGARSSCRNLLPQNGSHRKPSWVHRPRDPPTGAPGDESSQLGVRRQPLVDRLRVRVKVKHPPAPAEAAGQVALVGQRYLDGDVVGRRPERGCCETVRKPDRPTEGTVTPLLDSGNGGRRKVAEEVVRAERFPEWQSEGQGARVR